MNTKTQVYLMPGLAASPLIFENIKLDNSIFEVHYLEWQLPLKDETLSDYALRFSSKITQPNPVLIGVSFGGILVQEIEKHIAVKKVIIISSVKSHLEFPKRFKFAKFTGIYKLFPLQIFRNIESLVNLPFSGKIEQRLHLYEKFLSVRNTDYLKWSVKTILNWYQEKPNPKTIHIHGDKDDVFPIRNIKSCIVVPFGTHIMILHKHKWLNENLPNIILE
jgi:hypothetical protein